MPPKVRVAARSTGCRARPRRRGQDPSLRTNVHGCFVGSGLDRSVPVCGNRAFTGSHRAGHARPLPLGFGADATCITAVGRHAPMPPKVRVAARSTGCRARPRRRGQDPSLRTNVHGCFVGSGLDRSVPVCGNRAFTGSHRAGHARPLPLGFGADATCITAVGRHAPMPPKVRVAARSTGCRARPRRRGQDPSLRTNVHGCFVGSGLDRSVPVCGNRAFTGSHRAGHARPLPLGFGADATCITAVGRHAPMPPKVRVAARSTGCRASPAEGSRPLPTD